MHAPEVTDEMKREAHKLDVVSDDVDTVNILKLKASAAEAAAAAAKFDESSKFDAAKDKDGFRNYEAACDRVKKFYAVCPCARASCCPYYPSPALGDAYTELRRA